MNKKRKFEVKEKKCNFENMAYDKDVIFKEITDRISEGESLRSVLRDPNMPVASTFFEWLKNDEEKAKQYAYATELRHDTLFEQILEIADDSSNDTIETENGNKINSEWVNRSRLRVDARKWALSKMNPKKYGDKIQQDHTSNGKTVNIISLGSGVNPNDGTPT